VHSLISVPHPSIGSRIPDDHLPPLGLSIGGPLLDDGHDVRLIDGECHDGNLRQSAPDPGVGPRYPLTILGKAGLAIAAA
jgi:hypothetical protein